MVVPMLHGVGVFDRFNSIMFGSRYDSCGFQGELLNDMHKALKMANGGSWIVLYTSYERESNPKFSPT